MLARKMVEKGVPFIEIGQSGYDTHADNFMGHKGLVPPMEKAWSGLLIDLQQRGLLEKTLVIWMGEIGRTPRINNRSGRDHYVRSWSTALADSKAASFMERPMRTASTSRKTKSLRVNSSRRFTKPSALIRKLKTMLA